ncbi:MAG TPA: oligosaccharide flippase family protein [Blastocatellia bacterium]|nr:oligosaccharide flippase family protein [Blastocatellia bacterium]
MKNGLSGQDGQSGFVSRAAWLTTANSIAFGLSFVAPLLLVRTLSQTEFGLYKQVFQILMTAISALNLQVASTAYYFMPRAPEKKLQVTVNVLAFYGGVGALVAALFIFYPECALLVFKSEELPAYMPLLGVTILLWMVSSNLEVIPLALGDVRTSSVFIVVAQLMKSALTIVAALAFHSVRAMIWAAVIQGLLQILLMFAYIRRRFGSLHGAFDWGLFKAQVGNALPYGLGSFAQTAQADLHNFAVSRYFPPAGFAIYSVGLFQLPLLGLLTASFGSALIPEVSQLAAAGDQRGIIPIWLNAVRKLALVVVPICALTFVLRYEIITLLFTNAYREAAPLFGIYLFIALLPMTLTGSLIRAHEEFKYFRFKLHLALLPVTFGALYVGIHAAGLIGAAVAVVVTQTLEAAIVLTAVGRRLGFVANDLRHLAPAMRTALATAAATLAAFAMKLPLVDAHTLVKMLICGAVFGAVYIFAAHVLGAVTDAEKAEFRATLSRFLSRWSRSRRSIAGHPTSGDIYKESPISRGAKGKQKRRKRQKGRKRQKVGLLTLFIFFVLVASPSLSL